MIAGVFPCSLTHTLLTPLDVVKCQKQIYPEKYTSLRSSLSLIMKENGLKGLYLGWQPTILGYSLQGSVKYGLYEVFKDFYKNILGPQHLTVRYMLASATAEVFADCVLCPFESLKVRMQTSKPGTFPTGLVSGFNELKKEGTHGFFKGLVPVIMRQVPNTMVKFATYENTVKLFYKHIFKKEKSDYSKFTKLAISFMSGYVAGSICCVVSNPADMIVSKVNSVRSERDVKLMQVMRQIYSDVGFFGLWRGLYLRILIVGTLSALEWLIYDSFKTLIGLETTGSRHG